MVDHSKHCFIAIPSGKDDDQKIEYGGWLNEVVIPAVRAAGFKDEVVAASDAPTSITNDILEHLTSDPVAIFDVAGPTVDADANPNVMYELGVRHAFKMPSIILGRAGQRLPFDVNDQRGILVDRRPLYFGTIRERIQRFIENAAAGKYYNPLQSMERIATLEKTGDSAMEVVAKELREMRAAVERIEASPPTASKAPAVTRGEAYKRLKEVTATISSNTERVSAILEEYRRGTKLANVDSPEEIQQIIDRYAERLRQAASKMEA